MEWQKHHAASPFKLKQAYKLNNIVKWSSRLVGAELVKIEMTKSSTLVASMVKSESHSGPHPQKSWRGKPRCMWCFLEYLYTKVRLEDTKRVRVNDLERVKTAAWIVKQNTTNFVGNPVAPLTTPCIPKGKGVALKLPGIITQLSC